MATREVITRFEAERQALALMDHPNIAHVLDGGATPQGGPFFVMELIQGIPITDYCDRERLSMTDRLRLFIQVCNAVQHTHQKGVIHRDLKPGNNRQYSQGSRARRRTSLRASNRGTRSRPTDDGRAAVH